MSGMYMVRPSALELNTMTIILGDMDGAAAWGWGGMYSARNKARDTMHREEVSL